MAEIILCGNVLPFVLHFCSCHDRNSGGSVITLLNARNQSLMAVKVKLNRSYVFNVALLCITRQNYKEIRMRVSDLPHMARSK